ncbi:MAG: PspC domain-containing protein [Anaerolineales bacterium]|jgi:phage shock protein PspC (stress-responsive transcriptional regulator)
MTNKKLYRVPSKGMIGGVCVGLGEYLGLDPTIVRLIFVLLTFAGLSGILIYIIMWLIIPVKPAEPSSISESEELDQ